MQLRVMKDDYDFASGLFYSVQEAGCVLGAIAFRSNGGDKHPSLDPIRDGSFRLNRLYAQFLFPVWDDAWQILVNGKPWTDTSQPIPVTGRISIGTGSCVLCFQFRTAGFGKSSPMLRFRHDKGQAHFDLALFESQDQQTVRWADMNEAQCSFTLIVEERRRRLADFDRRCAARRFAATETQEQINFTWESPSAPLELTVQRGVHPVAQMDAGYAARAMGKSLPMVRLSDEKILRSPELPRGSTASG
jgi:hypothetical protein